MNTKRGKFGKGTITKKVKKHPSIFSFLTVKFDVVNRGARINFQENTEQQFLIVKCIPEIKSPEDLTEETKLYCSPNQLRGETLP